MAANRCEQAKSQPGALPAEVFYQCFELLEPWRLLICCRTCAEWYSRCRPSQLWSCTSANRYVALALALCRRLPVHGPAIPIEYLCPLCNRIMQNPVLCKYNGQSYEREALILWHDFQKCNPDGTPSHSGDKDMVQNVTLGTEIQTWMQRNEAAMSLKLPASEPMEINCQRQDLAGCCKSPAMALFLEKLALAVHARNIDITVYSHPHGNKTLDESLGLQGIDDRLLEALVAGQCCLIVPVPEATDTNFQHTFRFAHLSFQEYLAARRLVGLANENSGAPGEDDNSGAPCEDTVTRYIWKLVSEQSPHSEISSQGSPILWQERYTNVFNFVFDSKLTSNQEFEYLIGYLFQLDTDRAHAKVMQFVEARGLGKSGNPEDIALHNQILARLTSRHMLGKAIAPSTEVICNEST